MNGGSAGVGEAVVCKIKWTIQCRSASVARGSRRCRRTHHRYLRRVKAVLACPVRYCAAACEKHRPREDLKGPELACSERAIESGYGFRCCENTIARVACNLHQNP